MEGMITVAIAPDAIGADAKATLDELMDGLGLKTTLPRTEGGVLNLPPGTYGRIIQIEDQMEQLKHYYRSLVQALRKVDFKGKYFISVSQSPAYICGEL